MASHLMSNRRRPTSPHRRHPVDRRGRDRAAAPRTPLSTSPRRTRREVARAPADNHFYRYTDHGATLESFRPGVVTPEVDDRPWLAAHHDGYVYYMSTTGYRPD